MPTKDEFEQRLEDLLAQAETRNDERLRKVLDFIAEANKEILDRLRDARRFESQFLPALRGELAQVLDSLYTRIGAEVETFGGEVVAEATRLVQEPLSLVRVETAFPAIPRNILETYEDFTVELIRGVTDEARSKIAREVTLVSVGAKKRAEAIERIGMSLEDDASVFKNVATRAETILNTELRRLRGQATHLRQVQAAERLPGLRKWWLTAGDGRVRGSHRQAGLNYSQDKAIPVRQKFIVGAFRADHPRDFSLPAKESVNCRCESPITVPEDLFEEE